MRKIIACCASAAIALLCTCGISAQNRNVEFAPETDTLEEAFAKAAAQGKTVFMDCYTSWCGPCKMMARDVFTTDRVADFLNGRFYCVKYDMEKGEGPAIGKKYNVRAYPTFLFIDPETGSLVNVLSGAHPADDFIAAVNDAMDPERSMDKVRAAYESGNRNPETVNNYLSVLANGHQKEAMKIVALDYLGGMTKEQLAEIDSWRIFMRCGFDLSDEPVQTVFNNLQFFEDAIGEREVIGKTEGILYSYVRPFVSSLKAGPDPKWDQEAFEEAEKVIAGLNHPSVPGVLLHMEAAEANQKGDYKTVLKDLNRELKKNVIKGANKLFFQVANVSRLSGIESKSLQKRAVRYFDKALAAAGEGRERASLEKMVSDVRTKWMNNGLNADKRNLNH